MRGTKSKYLQFLRVLQDVTETTPSALARLIGKQQSNVSDYLNEKKPVDRRAIDSAVRHLSEWSVRKDKTMLPLGDKNRISTSPGIYFIYDSSGNCIYIGQALNLRTEVSQRLKTKTLRHGIWRDRYLKKKEYSIDQLAAFVTTYVVVTKRLRHNLEALFLQTMINQTQNNKLGNFI